MKRNSNLKVEGDTNVRDDLSVEDRKITRSSNAKWNNFEVFDEEQAYVNSAKDTPESRKALVRGQQILTGRRLLRLVNNNNSIQQLRRMNIF